MRILNEERPHFSISQLTSYLQCPLRYQFEYVQGMPWPCLPSAVAFGDAIHTAIGIINLSLMNGGVISLDKAINEFTSVWNEMLKLENIDWKTAGESEELLAKGNNLVSLYYESFRSCKMRAVELEFRIPALSPDGFLIESHDLVGKVDAISQGGTIIEIKTSSKKPCQLEIDTNLQLTLYSYAYRLIYGLPEEKINIIYLMKTKEPELYLHKTARSEKSYARLFQLIGRVLESIAAGIFYPNPLNVWGCRGCPYLVICEKWPE